MTSNDGSAPAHGSPGFGGRRRALGRGPGAVPVAPTVPPQEAESLEEVPLAAEPGPQPEPEPEPRPHPEPEPELQPEPQLQLEPQPGPPPKAEPEREVE